jgi:hypothetical protein
MRRALVVTDESAHHRFRASLPPHVCKAAAPATQHLRSRISVQDVKEFLLAYCACFAAVSTFIA